MKSPIKLSIKTELVPLLIIIASFGLGFYFYAHFPERVASHWNFAGQVDGYMSKFWGTFFMPFLGLGMYFLFLILPFFDPKKESYAQFENVYHIFRSLIIGFLFIIFVATGLFNLGYPVKIGLIVPIAVGLLFIILGNYLGKIKPNWFVGIRTPWTLSSENVWNKMHRVGGWLFILLGLIMIIIPFLPEIFALPIFLVSIVGIIGFSFLYSYIAYRQEKK